MSRARACSAANALADAGQNTKAVEQLTLAHAELTVCGAQRLADQVARDLRRSGQRVSRRAKRGAGATGMPALSGRERQVADLVATGKTNRQIATELFVSEKTVEGHLANVFAKLGVSARAAVAAQVAAQPR
jgi:DNA-binding NarL/FixJ family response regulator